jgi:hypothetical protein
MSLRAGPVTISASKALGSEQLATVIPDTIYGSTAFTAGVHRGGIVGAVDALIQSSSNLGLASSVDSNTWAVGMVCNLLAGAKLFKMRAMPNVVQPTVLDAWALGLYRVDVLLNWVASAAGTDSGLVLWLGNGTASFPNTIVGGAADGIIVYNDNGTLKFFSRGNGNTETVVIDSTLYGNLVTDWTRVALEFRMARKTAPADVRLLVNGQLVVQRKYTGAHALPVPAAAATGWWQAAIVHRVSTTTLGIRFAQANLAIGPDSDGV